MICNCVKCLFRLGSLCLDLELIADLDHTKNLEQERKWTKCLHVQTNFGICEFHSLLIPFQFLFDLKFSFHHQKKVIIIQTKRSWSKLQIVGFLFIQIV